MTKNDIKKSLYKEKPIAKENFSTKNFTSYITQLENGIKVQFKIPTKELYDEQNIRIINEKVNAQLLIRWLVYDV